ncbi:toll/interleukin-1 receptor domain-containing protein [Streptomyces sp. NBC_00334]|uniref:toll/interleukin-1 receptor domain-containing protein n=1 Tax=Streptomyces sp. NBC_00334 TaxID=2975713 RepID=UPI002E2E3486|nr:toll/interleukin-1 receptor domain-containing protein [Streptomyces sp. NBC_00334]
MAVDMVTSLSPDRPGPDRLRVHNAADVAMTRPSQVVKRGFDSPIQGAGRSVFVEDAGMTPKWDFFISHASEDKLLVAGPLAHYLQSVGFSVWYDELSLRVGDSVLREIDRGLGASRYGVVVLSESFFAKQWPQRELAGLIATASDGERRVLPVWHGVDAAAVAARSPLLADVKAVNTSRGLHVVAEEIVRAAFPERVATLPLSNGAKERAADRETARKTLQAVLTAGGSREDVLLVLSAYQSLLIALTRYAARVVGPASRFTDLPCDFILYEPHGVTGPIQVTFVVLGSTEAGGGDLPAATDLAFGEEIPFAGRPSNDYLPGRRVGEFPSVLSAVRRLAGHVKSDNIHHAHPELWNFSVLLVHGRRGAQDPTSTAPTRLHFETASYDRLTDS